MKSYVCARCGNYFVGSAAYIIVQSVFQPPADFVAVIGESITPYVKKVPVRICMECGG